MTEIEHSRAEIHEAMSLIDSKKELVVEVACEWAFSGGDTKLIAAVRELERAREALNKAWEGFGSARK
jgi:hypothetical protein